jgi:hypothetical protein
MPAHVPCESGSLIDYVELCIYCWLPWLYGDSLSPSLCDIGAGSHIGSRSPAPSWPVSVTRGAWSRSTPPCPAGVGEHLRRVITNKTAHDKYLVISPLQYLCHASTPPRFSTDGQNRCFEIWLKYRLTLMSELGETLHLALKLNKTCITFYMYLIEWYYQWGGYPVYSYNILGNSCLIQDTIQEGVFVILHCYISRTQLLQYYVKYGLFYMELLHFV